MPKNKNNLSRNILTAFMLPVILATVGCQTARMAEYDRAFAAGDYVKSAEIAWSAKKQAKTSGEKPEGKLLMQLQAAAALRAAGRYEESARMLDNSEAIIIQRDKESDAMDAGQFLASLLVNDSVVPYEGETYDKIMVNTYKALNFLALGDLENARIEVNRAYERQGRAVDEFARKIQKQQEALKAQQQQSAADLMRSASNPELEKIVQKNYSNLDEWAAYPDFVNPFTTYVYGLIKLFGGMDQGTLADSQEFFKRTCGMVPANTYAGEDVVMMEKLLNGNISRLSMPPMVWVIFENGLGPQKGQVRIDIPLFLVSSNIQYTGIALPTLQYRPAAYAKLSVMAGAQSVDTQPLCSMEKVITTEFKKDLPLVVTRAILRTVVKTAAQYGVQQNKKDANKLLGQLFALYQAATNTADTRIWSALPKEFQVARMPMPEDRRLAICDAGKSKLCEVTIPEGRLGLVYVKIPQAGVPPAISVCAFK